MITKSILSILFSSMFLFTAFAQPSEAELKKHVANYYGDMSFVRKMEFGAAKIEKRWVKDKWKYFWSRKFTIEGKTDYPGIYQINYGGVQYIKSGSSYTFSNILTGGAAGFVGIPDPNKAEINAHLKKTFDPLNFYKSYLMNYLIDAPNTVHLADDPDWKWNGLNEVMCNVVSEYTVFTNDIGNVEKREGIFRVTLTRSEDGINFNEDAKYLPNGKWLPLSKGRERGNSKTLESYKLSSEEKANTRTFAQLHAERHAEEFKKSLAAVEMPKFDNSNHLLQFIHEMMIEGDEAKVTAFCYKMFQPNLFEEWSDIVLNRNGKEKLEGILEELPNYKNAYCKHPIIKDIYGTTVRFYDRNKRRMNTISVGWKNDRWYLYDISYVIRKEDYAGFEANKDKYCDGDPIYLDTEPQFHAGQKVEIYHGGNWREAEILKPEMNKGGYSVKYGVSGLTEWKYVSQVRAGENTVVEEAQAFKEFEVGEKVKVNFKDKTYDAVIVKVSYEDEEYLVDIPKENTREWIHNQKVFGLNEKTVKPSKEGNASNSQKEVKKDNETGKKVKKGLKGLKNRIRIN